MSTPDGVPLARLFAMAFRSLVDDLHAQLADRGWRDIRPPYGFVLLAVRDEPTTATDISRLLGLTKQAASKVLDAMEAADLVRRRSHAEDGRAKLVAITPEGRRLLRDVESIYAGLEAGWAAVVGAERVDALRRDVAAVLRAQNDGELPPIRPTW
jgi:DNA-binding MarR family transcriptional regulator